MIEKSALAPPPPQTRERLLAAAAQVFGERGYRAATVRDIVARAGANIAAVNYHFRDKTGLYQAVLEEGARAAFKKHPPYGGLGPDAPPEEQLRAFIHSFLMRLFDADVVYGKLMAREMIEPTAALDRIVEDVIRPLYRRLCACVRAVAGLQCPLEQVEPAAKSVVGQILFYKHCSPVLEKLGSPAPDARELTRIAEHITDFSLSALRGGKGAGRRSRR